MVEELESLMHLVLMIHSTKADKIIVRSELTLEFAAVHRTPTFPGGGLPLHS